MKGNQQPLEKQQRSGLIATKIGMSSMYFSGIRVPVTLLKIDENTVIDTRSFDSHGYNAVLLASMDAKSHRVSKPQRVQLEKAGLKPKREMKEFRVSSDALLQKGEVLKVDHFVAGQLVDLQAVSIGKGFQGVMKRHGHAGQPASHGVSIAHRSHGSTGQCQDPGKVFKGKAMAGHMGNKKVTLQNLRIVEIDPENGLLVIRGSVPGPKNGTVYISDARKCAIHPNAPYPSVAQAPTPTDAQAESTTE